MGSLVQPVALGGALLACAVLACAVLAVLLAVRARRRAVAHRAALDAELARSRADVELLVRRVEELGDQVVEARRQAAGVAAREADREYVITSLGHLGHLDQEAHTGALPVRSRSVPPLGRLVEERLVGALGRVRGESPGQARAVDLAVRTLALAHGVRRVLSPDVLDRAAAEAQVARRRSRRERRREIREARRLVRAVRTGHAQPRAEDAA